MTAAGLSRKPSSTASLACDASILSPCFVLFRIISCNSRQYLRAESASMPESSIINRLVVCVDGTWTHADGTAGEGMTRGLFQNTEDTWYDQ